MVHPRFVRDYNRLVRRVIALAPNYEAAMALAVGGGPYTEIGARQRRLLESLGLQDTHCVIDVGAGSGRLASALQDLPKLKYLGTDVVPELLEFARKKCNREDWVFKLINTLEIPERDKVADFVVFFSVFTHLTEEQSYRYLEEAKRVLKDDGKIVVSYLDPDIPTQLKMASRFGHPIMKSLGNDVFNQFLRWEHFCLKMIHGRALNQTLGRKILHRWANDLDLSIEYMDTGEHIGQSICAYRLQTRSDAVDTDHAWRD